MIKSIVLITAILAVSAQADFLMKLTDKNGVEESLCVKSYSYSNNLESLHKQQAQTIDEYSTQETLTNKRWMGKPVYRKVSIIPDFTVPKSATVVKKYTDTFPDLEHMVSLEFHALRGDNQTTISSSNSNYTIYGSDINQNAVYLADFSYATKQASIFIRQNVVSETWPIKNVNIVLEYTKTTDSVEDSQSQLVSYVHYVPSNSTSNELLSKSLKNKSVGFFENYTYDSVADSCIPPSN